MKSKKIFQCHLMALKKCSLLYMPKYRYAKNENGVIVDIKNVSSHGDFVCLGCGQLMNANIGQKNEHCFSHRNRDADSSCRPETYLHALGKEAFIRLFLLHKENGTPLSIASKRSCVCGVNPCPYGQKEKCQKQENDTLEIYPFYNQYEEEKWDYEYRPDVLLKSVQGEKLYIEIFVNSPCSPQKINSGIPIIEFFLKDEDDLELFTDESFAKIDNPKIKFYNYPKSPKILYNCFNGDLRRNALWGDSTKQKTNISSKIDSSKYVLAVLYKDGRLEIERGNIEQLYDFYESQKMKIEDYLLANLQNLRAELNGSVEESKFDLKLNKNLAEFFSEDYECVKNCFLCFNRADETEEYNNGEYGLCTYDGHKKKIHYTNANICNHYEPMKIDHENIDRWSSVLYDAYCNNRFLD